MAQDLRDLMKEQPHKGKPLREGHEIRFAEKLEQAFGKEQTPPKKGNPSFFWLKIVAAVIAFVAVGYWYFNIETTNNATMEDTIVDAKAIELPTTPQLTMGDISPDLKRIEDFYLAGINVQLASLTKNNDNKELIDGYMKRLDELNNEYKRLTNELNTVGPTEATINALIDNLKLRLDLLFKLKNKLKELKQLENEEFKNIEVL